MESLSYRDFVVVEQIGTYGINFIYLLFLQK